MHDFEPGPLTQKFLDNLTMTWPRRTIHMNIDGKNSQVHGIIQVVIKRYHSHRDSVNYRATFNIFLI